MNTAETTAAVKMGRVNGPPTRGTAHSSATEPPAKKGRQELSESPASGEASSTPRTRSARQAAIAANAKLQENSAKKKKSAVSEENRLMAAYLSDQNASEQATNTNKTSKSVASPIESMIAQPAKSILAAPIQPVVYQIVDSSADADFEQERMIGVEENGPIAVAVEQGPINDALAAANNQVQAEIQNVPAVQVVERAITIVTISDDTVPENAPPPAAPQIPAETRPEGLANTITLSGDTPRDEEDVEEREEEKNEEQNQEEDQEEEDQNNSDEEEPEETLSEELLPPLPPLDGSNTCDVRLEDIASIPGSDVANHAPTPPPVVYLDLEIPEEQGLSRYKIQETEQFGVLVKYAAGNIFHYHYNDSPRDFIRLQPFPTPDSWLPLFQKSFDLLVKFDDEKGLGKWFNAYCANQKYFYEFLKTPYETENLKGLEARNGMKHWLATPISKAEQESRFTYSRYCSILALYKLYESIWDRKDFALIRRGDEKEFEEYHMGSIEKFWSEEPSRGLRCYANGYLFLSDLMERTRDTEYLKNMPRAIQRLPENFKSFLKRLPKLYDIITSTLTKMSVMCDPIFDQLDTIKDPDFTLPVGACLQKLFINIGNCIVFHGEQWTILPERTDKVFENIPFGPRGTEVPKYVPTAGPSAQ